MGPYFRRSDAVLAALLAILCVIACSMTYREARACETAPSCHMRVQDPPVVAYPQTRECAVHGSTVVLAFGDERYEVRPTPDELAYGMRYSREP